MPLWSVLHWNPNVLGEKCPLGSKVKDRVEYASQFLASDKIRPLGLRHNSIYQYRNWKSTPERRKGQRVQVDRETAGLTKTDRTDRGLTCDNAGINCFS